MLKKFGTIFNDMPGNVFGTPENVRLCYDGMPDNVRYAV